jgi:hypothetical protein
VTEIGDDAIRADVEAAAEEVGDAAYNLAELGPPATLGSRSGFSVSLLARPTERTKPLLPTRCCETQRTMLA